MLSALFHWVKGFSNHLLNREDNEALDQVDDVAEFIALIPSAMAEGPQARAALAQALFESGLAHLRAGRPAKAARALASAKTLGFDAQAFSYNLALAYSRSGQAAAAHVSFEEAVSKPFIDRVGDGYYLRNAHAIDGIGLNDLKHIAGKWADRHIKDVKCYDHAKPRRTKTKLRVGLMSGRFSRHAVGFLTLAGLEHVDSAKAEFILYANRSPEDDYSARYRTIASAWHDISDLSDDGAADLIHSHNLDILIDMAGHSDGGRTGVIARKPVAVQAKWAGGQHGTTGIKALDYFITDMVETPLDHDRYFFEKPIRLPNAYACYSPVPDAPDISPLPAVSNGFVTFGCFNNIAKLTDRTISTWAEILDAVPNSKLILKHLALSERETCDRITDQFRALNISADRIEMRTPTDQRTHLQSYADIDIALDPFPWSGCVTTCESLWMGIPVLTLPGVAFCHRHSASFLSAVGLEDWICTDTEDYVQKAVAKARDSHNLTQLRNGLREKVSESPLCDAETFAMDFEALLLEMSGTKSAG